MTLFTIPDATTTIAQISEYSSPWFTELLPIAYVAIGISFGVLFVLFLIGIINGAFGRLLHLRHGDWEFDEKGNFKNWSKNRYPKE